MRRVCRACGIDKPITEFSKHNAGWRHLCKDCRRLQHNKWQLGLDGKKLRKFDRDRARSSRKYQERMRHERANKHKERHELLRTVVQAMYRDGLTQKELARLSKVSAHTLRRITSEGPLEKGITEPVEERLLEFYARWRRKAGRIIVRDQREEIADA